jgi:glutathione peroxidase
MHTEKIYQFDATKCNGSRFSLSQLQGKTLLIVNTASKCHFSTQLCALEKLYQHYKHAGFTILAFPCNQFGKNEPLESPVIKDYYQQHFDVNFEVFDKVMINGPDAHPLFSYLKSHTRGVAQNRAIKWNFTKFIINKQGELVARYAPRTKPESLHNAVENCLAQG